MESDKASRARRDDFSPATREILARRVGFVCSVPTCGQPTSGPQEDPLRTSIGVAAHITAAAPDGPRYDSSLTSEQRCSAENGIWLCQNRGKLVDNDPSRYTVECLREWKKTGEENAIRALEQPRSVRQEEATPFAQAELLMPELIKEMRADLGNHPLSREFVVMSKNHVYWAGGHELVYYHEDHAQLESKLRILQNLGLIQDITYNDADRYVMSEGFAASLRRVGAVSRLAQED